MEQAAMIKSYMHSPKNFSSKVACTYYIHLQKQKTGLLESAQLISASALASPQAGNVFQSKNTLAA